MPVKKRVKVVGRRVNLEEIPSVGYRINSVMIPGSTGGLYTIGSGFMLIVITAGVYLFGFIFNKPIPAQFNDLLYSAVGLLTIHAGRAVFGSMNAGRVAQESIQGIRSGQEINVSIPDGEVTAEISERPAPPMMPIDDEFNDVKG